ncbi:hypothetical protein IV203_001056 [Nitzschia inconspicua]|uniref:Uncharacterized protein n=1 Tax=Nitzschia inconspicua TaxID=303405 RepID=A0A9K3L7K8_9STRA|nr:hypothetical protein IV203_001056 [Nitzschia inconspicua]
MSATTSNDDITRSRDALDVVPNAGSTFANSGTSIIEASTNPNNNDSHTPSILSTSRSVVAARSSVGQQQDGIAQPIIKSSSSAQQSRPVASTTMQFQSWKPHPFDVFHGSSKNSGNEYFTSLVKQHLQNYTLAQKCNNEDLRRAIADKIISDVEEKGGHFLGPFPAAARQRKQKSLLLTSPPPLLTKERQYKKVHRCMLRRIKASENKKKRPASALTYPPSSTTNSTAAATPRIRTILYTPSPPTLSPQKRRRTISTKFRAAVKAGMKQAMTHPNPPSSSNSYSIGITEETVDTSNSNSNNYSNSRCSASARNASDDTTPHNSYINGVGNDSSDETQSFKHNQQDVVNDTLSKKEEPKEDSDTSVQESASSACLSPHNSDSPQSQSNYLSLREVLEPPKTPFNNEKTRNSSTMSSISSMPSTPSRGSITRQGLFLSPPSTPLKRNKSCRDDTGFNVARTDFLGFPKENLLSPGSVSAWNSFLVAPRSPMIDISFESNMQENILEYDNEHSPGFLESPIGWPTVFGGSANGDDTSILACSLMNGMMIQTPSLGPYPSPSANLRRISVATTATNIALQQHPTPSRTRQSSTPVYEMGQSQSFSWTCEVSSMDDTLKSLRINLSKVYSGESPMQGTIMMDPVGKNNRIKDSVLSPIDRNLFPPSNALKKGRATAYSSPRGMGVGMLSGNYETWASNDEDHVMQMMP